MNGGNSYGAHSICIHSSSARCPYAYGVTVLDNEVSYVFYRRDRVGFKLLRKVKTVYNKGILPRKINY